MLYTGPETKVLGGRFILPCSYATQSLSNGEQVEVITVYVPTNYVFTGYGPWTVVKQVVHETTTRTKIVGPPEHTPAYNYGKAEGKIDGKYGVYDAGAACAGFTGKDLDHCITGYHDEFLAVCVDSPNGCGDAIVNYPPRPICIDSGYTGLKVINPSLRCPGVPYPPSCESKYYTGPCPPIDPNAYTKCESAALLANDKKGELACARLLPDTPENKYTKCESEALIKDDLRAELACAKYLLPITSGASNNMTNTTTSATAPPTNTSAAIQPTNTSNPTTPSGGKGSGSTCSAGNCASETTPPPPVDCAKNPTDPSCTQTQTLTPSTTTPTTKTCSDGSVIDASANCPTQSTPPTNPNTPSTTTPSTSGTPPSGNNNPPSGSGSSSNGAGSTTNSGGSGGSGEGSSSGGSSSSGSGSGGSGSGGGNG